MNQPQTFIERAERALAEGDIATARALVGEALTLAPDNITAWEYRARLAGNVWEARRSWEKVLSLQPGHPEASAFLGQGAAKQREREKAENESPGVAGATMVMAGAGGSGTTMLPVRLPLPSIPNILPAGESLLVLGRQLAFSVLLLLALIFLTFLGLEMARGAEFGAAVAHAAPETVSYIARLASGDLGMVADIAGRPDIPVTQVVRDTLPKSLGLLALSLLFATVVGSTLGALAAFQRRGEWSLLLIVASTIGVSVPSFFAAILLQWGVIRWVRLFDGPAPLPIFGFGWDRHLVLPLLVLAARPVAQITRVTFLSLKEVLGEDFVRTAHSKGLASRVVLRRHVLRNALIPVLTTIGLSLRFSLSSLPVVELFFGWPGVGFTLLQGIARQDDYLTVALILCLGLFFILVNGALEFSYRHIDPRLRDLARKGQSGERGSLLGALRVLLADLGAMVVENPLVRRLRQGQAAAAPSPFKEVLARQGATGSDSEQYRGIRWRAWMRGTLRNFPLVAGTLLLAIPGFLYFFGPALAPHNPYTTTLVARIDGEFFVPPFSPGEIYPWGTDFLGRDIMSLVLAGAQQTLLLGCLVVAGRMVIGILLGALAGWTRGSWVDRFILGLAEILSAFPTLLLAMILILALGIRQGLQPFIIALTFIGWGEVMQYVRSEVLAIKPRPFIESAVAVGMPTPRIVIGHVLPNLIAALVSIAALEMGAVLMLLGELGFVGIFIGGGIISDFGHYSDVPEWGALLANIRRYVRSYPWMAMYPAGAFFLAIVAFNLFGEGMRRLVDNVGVNLTRLANRYTLGLAILAFLAFFWIRDNTGDAAFYTRQAELFDGERAMTHVRALTDPALEGRSLGTEGQRLAAEYIAAQFDEFGLQDAGDDLTAFQHRERSFEVLTDVPELSINDGGPALIYHEDFVEIPVFFRNMGEARGPVQLLKLGPMTGGVPLYGRPTAAVQGLRYPGQVLLVLTTDDLPYVLPIPKSGVLVVADDPSWVGRTYTLSALDPGNATYGARAGDDTPILWISEATAERILAASGTTLAAERRARAALGQDKVEASPIDLVVSMRIEGETRTGVPTSHVIGHWPGNVPGPDQKMILVLAQYDTPPPSPDGIFHPGANSASGVAVMLEAIRSMKASGYQPSKTFLFVAYSGEGQEGREWVGVPEPDAFLQAKYGFSSAYEVETVIHLNGLGAGTGNAPLFEAGGSLRLASIFETASRRMDAGAARDREPVNLSVVFQDRPPSAARAEAARLRLAWEGWEATALHAEDTVDMISPEKMERAGEMLAHALMILGRDVQQP